MTTRMFQPLVDLDELHQFVPMLADSIESKDNQIFEAKLNADAKWTDGQPVSTDDLIFTVQFIGNPKVMQSLGSILSIVEGFDVNGRLVVDALDIPGVKKIDGHTVQIRAKSPVDMDLFNEKIGKNIKTLPKHVLQNVDPGKLHQDPFMLKPTVSNGPFKLVTFAKDQYLEFAANKNYFKGEPKLDKLIFKIMPESNIVAQLQNGEIDMNFPGAGGNIPVEDIEKVKNMPDPKVRQAIVYAINRKQLIDKLLNGEGEATDVPYTSIHPYYNKNLKTYSLDAEKAKSLLKEAGWDSNRTLNFVVPTGNKTRENATNIIVENLKEVGVKAQIQKADYPAIVQKAKKGDLDMLIFALTYYRDPDLSMYFKTGDAFNFSGYSNPEVDDLLVKGTKQMYMLKRVPIYNQIREIIERDVPQITLYSEYRLKVVSKRVKVGGPKELGLFGNVHEWDVND